MPFESKAQQRWMFATSPDKAREWANETKDFKGLPEKINPQINPKKRKLPPMSKNATGMFFEKMSRPTEGNYLRDMPGRKDGSFYEKQAQAMVPGGIPSGAGSNVSPRFGTGAPTPPKPETTEVDAGQLGSPVGGSGFRGDNMAGQGQSVGIYGTGKGRSKCAGVDPASWDADSGLPSGLHRPTNEQPEALEAGGERFHDTTTSGPQHGLLETGGVRRPAGYGHQIGKHASPSRFLGTMYGHEKTAGGVYDWLKARGSEAGGSLQSLGRSVGEAADEGAKSITRSPVLTGLAAVLAARYGLKKLKRGGRALKNLTVGPPKTPKPEPKGLLGRASKGLQDFFSNQATAK